VTKRRIKGEGSISYQQSRDRWLAQITLPNGKRRTKAHKNKKVVLDWLTEQRNKIKKGTYVTDDKISLGEFILSYIEGVAKHNLVPRTYQTYYGYVTNHIVPELGRIKLASLRPEQVQDFYTKKLNEDLSTRTVQQIHSILRKTLQQALRWGKVSRNVCDLIDPPRPKREAPNVLTPEQVNIFLDAVCNHPYYPIYILAIYTGMRQSEIIGLYTTDIDLDRGTLQVQRTIQYVRGQGFVTADVKTEKSRRRIELPETAVNILREHMKGVESKLLFTASTGNPVYNNNLYRHFKETLKALNLPAVTFHSLRHFHASALLVAGIHPKVVQERLGHSQIATTLDTYSHTIPSLGKQAAEKFDSILNRV
jgi:integrase